MEQRTDLEIPVTRFQNISNFKKLVDIRAAKGFLVKDTEIREWAFSGFRYRSGEPVLYGPPAPGLTLAAVLDLPRDRALDAVYRLILALLLVHRTKENKVDIAPESVRFLEDGSVLFLPAEVFRKFRLLSDDAYKIPYSLINDPYADDEEKKSSHAVGVLLYKIFTGVFPFAGKDLEEIHAQIRHRQVVPPHLLFTDLKEEVSERIRLFFLKENSMTLPAWEKAVGGWQRDGYLQSRNEAEKTELETRRGQAAARRGRNIRRGVFWEKHRKTVFFAAAIAVTAGVVAGSIIANFLKPRLTAGFSPLKIVTSYYQSINDLNPDVLRDCLKGDAGAGESRRAEFLFVNTRQIYSMTGQSYRIPADVWEKRGRPRVDPPLYVDGVAGLILTEEKSGTEWVYLAAFERWLEEPEAGGSGNIVYEKGLQVKERLTLVKDSQGWLISRIERLEEKAFYKSEYGYQPGKLMPENLK